MRLKDRFVGIREMAVKCISMAVNLIDCAIILHSYLESNIAPVKRLGRSYYGRID